MLVPKQETPPQSPGADQNAQSSLEPQDHPQISLGHEFNMLIVSHNVKSKIKYLESYALSLWLCQNIRVILIIHNDDGNPSRANITQALGR